MSVYITSTGHHLPGPAINNDEIEDILGRVHGKPSRLKKRILQSNGIQTRHYAMNAAHETTISNSAMAAKAAQDCLDQSPLDLRRIQQLSAATSQGDLVLPSFCAGCCRTAQVRRCWKTNRAAPAFAWTGFAGSRTPTPTRCA